MTRLSKEELLFCRHLARQSHPPLSFLRVKAVIQNQQQSDSYSDINHICLWRRHVGKGNKVSRIRERREKQAHTAA